MSIRLNHSVFIHIPRTGGLWFGAVVEMLGLKHQTLRGDLDSHLPLEELPPIWRNLPAFTFIRHPWSWLASRWSHLAEHEMAGDYRHYGIHRAFDELFSPDFEKTIRNILAKRPGLVGETYRAMTTGVRYIRRTEDLPVAAYELLRDLEGIEPDSEEIIKGTPPTNSTSSLEKYRDILEWVDPALVKRFHESEPDAHGMWREAQ